MFITFASVGYGDMYPLTVPGKIITTSSFIMGFMTTSLLTYSLMNALNFEPDENKAFNMYQKRIVQSQLELEIVNLFFSLRRLSNLIACKKTYRSQLFAAQCLNEFYKSYRKLKKKKVEFRTLEGLIQNNQGELTKQRLELYFDLFHKDIEKVSHHQQKIAQMSRRWMINKNTG